MSSDWICAVCLEINVKDDGMCRWGCGTVNPTLTATNPLAALLGGSGAGNGLSSLGLGEGTAGSSSSTANALASLLAGVAGSGTATTSSATALPTALPCLLSSSTTSTSGTGAPCTTTTNSAVLHQLLGTAPLPPPPNAATAAVSATLDQLLLESADLVPGTMDQIVAELTGTPLTSASGGAGTEAPALSRAEADEILDSIFGPTGTDPKDDPPLPARPFPTKMPCPFGSKGLPPPVYVPPRSRAFPGDWICGLCGDLQFARNWKCRVCGGPRPRDGGSWSSGSNRCGDYYHHHHHHEHYGRSWGSGGRRSSGGNGCSSSEGLFSQRCLERTQSRSKRDDGPYSRRGIFERRTSNYMELSDDEEDSARGSRSANGKLKSRSREDEDDEFRRDYKLDFSPKSTLLLPDESYEQLRKDAKLRLEVNFPDINPRTSTTTDGIITTSTSTTAMPMPASRDVVMSGEHEGSCLNLGIHPAGILLDSALTTNKTISDISAAAVPKAIPAIIDSTCASECGAATTSASSPELLSSARSSPTATSSLCPLPSPRVNKIPPPTRSASKMPSPATSACSSTSVGGTRTSSTATTIYAGAQSSITGGTPVFPPHTSTIVQQHPHLLRGHQGATTSGGTIYYNGGGSYGTYPSRRGHHRHLTGPERRELAASRIRHHVHKPKPLDYNQFNPAKTSTSTSTTPNEMENDNENARPSNEGATTPKKKDDVGGSTSASSDTKTSTSMAELQVDLDTENKVVEPPGAADGQSRDTNRMSAGGAEQRVSASSSVMNASGDTPEVPAAKGARSETTEAAVSSSGEGAMETDVNLVPQAPLGVQRENTGATNALSSSLDAILTVHQRQLQQDQEQQELVSGQQQQEAVDRQREVAQRVENLQAAFTPTEDALPLNAISASSVVVPGTEANPIPFNATAACLNQNQIPTSSSLHEASATSNTSPSTAASDPSTTEEVRKQLSSCETPIADAAEVGDATLGKVVTSRAVRVRPAPY